MFTFFFSVLAPTVKAEKFIIYEPIGTIDILKILLDPDYNPFEKTEDSSKEIEVESFLIDEEIDIPSSKIHIRSQEAPSAITADIINEEEIKAEHIGSYLGEIEYYFSSTLAARNVPVRYRTLNIWVEIGDIMLFPEQTQRELENLYHKLHTGERNLQLGQSWFTAIILKV